MSFKKFLILSGLIFSITVIPVSNTYAQPQQEKAKVKAKKNKSNANKSSSNYRQKANNPCPHIYVGKIYKMHNRSAFFGIGETTHWQVIGFSPETYAVSMQNINNRSDTFEADCRKLPEGDYAEYN